MLWLSNFWNYWHKRLLIVLVVAGAVHLLEIGYYLLNANFILRNIDALPFKYQIALGYGQLAWWSFLVSFVTGLLVAAWIPRRR